jgi:hypothetical protein
VGTLVFMVTILVMLLIGRERRNRRAFAEDGPAFRCRFRSHGARPRPWRRLRRRWSRWMWARWTGELLVIRRGPIGDRTLRLTARVQSAGVYVLPSSRAIAVRMSVGDATVEVTAAAHDRLELVGPFLAAAVHDLPQAPVGRYRR